MSNQTTLDARYYKYFVKFSTDTQGTVHLQVKASEEQEIECDEPLID